MSKTWLTKKVKMDRKIVETRKQVMSFMSITAQNVCRWWRKLSISICTLGFNRDKQVTENMIRDILGMYFLHNLHYWHYIGQLSSKYPKVISNVDDIF